MTLRPEALGSAAPSPNSESLPGVGEAEHIVGALLIFGVIAAVAGLVVSAIVWAVGGNSSNPRMAHPMKSGALIALIAALLIRLRAPSVKDTVAANPQVHGTIGAGQPSSRPPSSDQRVPVTDQPEDHPGSGVHRR